MRIGAKLLLIKRLLGHAEPAVDLRDRLTRRLLRQCVDDRIFGETLLLHMNLHLLRRPYFPRQLSAGSAK